MKTNDMKVVSIDPASSKGGIVFEGKKFEREKKGESRKGESIVREKDKKGGWFKKISAARLPEYCDGLSNDPNVLLCWDAPLTGPPFLDNENNYPQAYSHRIIEKFFPNKQKGKVRKDNRRETPVGISVKAYCECSHWSISLASLGYPLIGKFDKTKKLPFALIHNEEELGETGRFLVETHPALAIWLWLDGPKKTRATWSYKGNKKGVKKIWGKLRKVKIFQTILPDSFSGPENDDELDAIVGWVLGKLLVSGSAKVAILGTASTGSFLLPVVDGLEDNFNQFLVDNKWGRYGAAQ